MRWLIVKQKESLNEYSYATYIYHIIANDVVAQGGIIIELTDEEKLVSREDCQNILYVINGPDSAETIMRLWYSVSLPLIVKKLKAEKIIYLNGLLGLYKSIRSPQIMLLYGTHYLLNPKLANKWQQLSFKRIAKNVDHATLSFTYSAAAIDSIAEILNSALSAKIKMLRPAPHPIFKPIDWEEKQEIKNKYSVSNEYFLIKTSSQNIDEIVHYLKAFSVFKKWQQSSMKLIMLVSETITKDAKFKSMIASYVFREDVFFIGEMERDEYHLLLAASYVFLMLTERDSDLLYVLEAIQCDVPVITYESPSAKELAGDAPYYLAGKSIDNLSQAIISLYKSEKLRETHIDKGKDISSQFNFEATKQQLMIWLNNV